MLFVVIKYQNISPLSTPGLLWLEETLEDVAKEALISLCFCPKLESLIVLSYIQEVIYLGGGGERHHSPYRHSARSQGRTQSIWPESEDSEEKRQSEPQHSTFITGNKIGNTILESMQDNLYNAKTMQTKHPNDD